jgi:Holliday junction DNA helicase RuvA
LPDLLPDYLPNLFHPEHSEATNSEYEEFEEAVLALVALGYSEREIKKISPALKKESLTTDQYIRKGLQMLLRS